MELREIPVWGAIIVLMYWLWLATGPERDERRARKAKRP